MTELITDPSAMTPAWLTEVLGGRFGGVTVTDVKWSPVGTGQMGDSVRLSLSHDGGPGVPDSVVAKLPAADPTSRATALGMQSYRIEVSFYRDLAPTLDMRVPEPYFAAHDPATDDFVLLLEDMAPAEQGDQLMGCSLEQAEVAVRELPGLHAPRWDDSALGEIDWLARNKPDALAFTVTMITQLYAGFRERYDGRISPEVMGVAEQLIANLGSYLVDRGGPFTVTHGDYRLDNLLFGLDETSPPVAVVDWQTVVHGPGATDLAYFVGAGLHTEHRRAHERDLVALYREEMAGHGVALDPGELFDQYRRFTFGGLIMAIAASMLVEQTDRGDEMFIVMAERHGQHAIDLDALDLLA